VNQTGKRCPLGRFFEFHQEKSELFFQGHRFAQPFHYILNAVDLLDGEFPGTFISKRPFEVGVSGFDIERCYPHQLLPSIGAQQETGHPG
jgi:hypothetical protein